LKAKGDGEDEGKLGNGGPSGSERRGDDVYEHL
jgi:hypothetical protein